LQDTIVKLENISMQFPGVLANDNISLEIKKGEVFALVGENGAGKSTLMNILYGLHTPTDGQVYVKGEKIERFKPMEAIEKGVGMVHQHFMLIPSFTVAQNIVLSKEPKKMKFLYDIKKANKETQALSDEYGLVVDPEATVGEISVGLQQRVEILKTLYRGADILILDEPTAVLTPQETDELFAVIRKIVKEKQMTVIIITHKLYEVMEISDRVGVMRQGKLIGVEETKNVNEKILSSMMVGREVLFDNIEKTGQVGEVLMEAEDVFVTDNRGLMAVNGISLKVKAGEILGIAAIEGNGQSELLEAFAGMRPVKKGKITICGNDATSKSPAEVRKMGLAHIPEDRIATGVAMQSSITDNMIIGKERRKEFAVKGIQLKRSSIVKYAQELFKKFDLRGAGVDVAVGSLSGGNMQKVVVAREFSLDTPTLLISQPTRGVDIGAIEFIHKQIIDKRNKGCAILLVSADLDEVFRLSDRIITLYEGKVTGEFEAGKIDKMGISYYMTGDRTSERGGTTLG
jgi:simple sugar transport system ATP-binding protein